jgi:hypothetical protein
MEGDTNNIVINWNNIVGQEARSIDNADLGKIQGLFEPFIVTERGTINKEKFYIPKSIIRRYNEEEVLYFGMTEQQARITVCEVSLHLRMKPKVLYRYYQKDLLNLERKKIV